MTTRDFDWERIADSSVTDDVGTVRVREVLGSIGVYIKIGEDAWRAVYVDPVRGDHLVAPNPLSDFTAGLHPVVYAPKGVV